MALILGELQVDIDGNPKGLQDAERVVAQSSKRINRNLESVDRQAKNTNTALGGIGRSAGQAGIQIQQFVGQIQGGQSVMLALSQQSADLGFVLGAPLLGAIAGISATIASFLLPSLFDSKDATEELEDALKDLEEVAIETSDGVEVLSKKLIELASKSQQAAAAEIQSGILVAMKALDIATKGTTETMVDAFGPALNATREGALGLENRLSRLGKTVGISGDEMSGLASAFIEVRDNASPEAIENLQKQADILAAKYGAANPEIVNLASNLREQTSAAGTAAKQLDFLNNITLKNLDDQIKKSEDLHNADKLRIQAVRDRIEAERTAREAERGVAGVETAGLDRAGLIEARFEAELEAIQAGRDLQLRTNAEFDQLEIEAEQRKADALKAIQDDQAKTALKQQQGELSNLESFLSSTSQLLAAAGKEGSAIAKAAFIAQKAIQIAQIFTATQLASIQAGAAVSAGGPFAFAGTVGFVQATGAAAAAAVAAQTVGAFENGGIVPGTSFSGDNLLANVNSGEMIINHSQQRKLFEMANGQGGGGGPMSVNVINNGAPLEVQSSSMSNGELTLMVDNKIAASENRINRSLSSGRGATAQSLQKGFNAERRL